MSGKHADNHFSCQHRFGLGGTSTFSTYVGAGRLQLGLASPEEGLSSEGKSNSVTVEVGEPSGFLGTFYVESLLKAHGWETVQNSPQRAEWFGDDDYFLRDTDVCGPPNQHCHTSSFPCLEAANAGNFSFKRPTRERPTGECQGLRRDLINTLPDELLCDIFRCLPRARDRAVCASVSMRWLLLQSHMLWDEFKVKRGTCIGNKASGNSATAAEMASEGRDEDSEEGSEEVFSCSNRGDTFGAGDKGGADERRVERQPQWAIGDLSRCLEGRKATDVRLAAIAVGTGARGGLGKLSVRGRSLNGQEKGVTDLGISAIGFCCSALRTLSLWDCPHVGDEGLATIGKGCRLLEKVDLLKCPLVGDAGLQAIAKNCPFLSDVSLEHCSRVGDKAIQTVGECCPGLLSLNICDCPCVGDEGIVAVATNANKLKRMKLRGVKVGDRSFAVLGEQCKSMIFLSLENLELITERGFMSLGKPLVMQSLKRLCVSSCPGLTDRALEVLGDCCNGLKHLSVSKCERITDQGLTAFLGAVCTLEILQLERCNGISNRGLVAALTTSHGKLRELKIVKCDGIVDWGLPLSNLPPCESSVKSLTISHCRGVGNLCLALIGHMCLQVTELDLSGLVSISDQGLLALLQTGNSNLISMNVSGCAKVSDQAVCAIAEQCGGSLQNLVLDGCQMVSDKSLKAIANYCTSLQDLDISQCDVTDKGVKKVVVERGEGLSSLNLSGCGQITKKILPLIEKRCLSLVGLNLKHCKGLSRKVLDNFESRLWKCDVFCA